MSGFFTASTGAAGLPNITFASTALASHSTSSNGTAFRGSRPNSSSSNRTLNSGGSSSLRVTQMEDYGPQVNFTIWLLTALSAAFLALRVYCKFLRHRGLWWDDHVLIASWVGILTLRRYFPCERLLTSAQLSLAGSDAFISVSINLGFGRPLSQFNFNRLNEFLLISNMSGTFSILAACWSKTSFAITVLRISSGWVKIVIWFIMITVNLALGGAVAITWCQCTPFEKIWQPALEGHCWPKGIQVRYNIFTASAYTPLRRSRCTPC